MSCHVLTRFLLISSFSYGDKTARTFIGRVFAVIWILVGLVICSMLIGAIGSAFTSITVVSPPVATMLYGARVSANKKKFMSR